jgi:hypothetical protein
LAVKKYLMVASNFTMAWVVYASAALAASQLDTVTIGFSAVEVIKSALDIFSAQYPQAKQTDPNLIVDPYFVKRIEQSGFIGGLYKK